MEAFFALQSVKLAIDALALYGLAHALTKAHVPVTAWVNALIAKIKAHFTAKPKA